MKLKYSFAIVACAVLVACGQADRPGTPAAATAPADEQFDAAVAEMTSAYFYHVPEAATQLGISEDIVPETSTRMMDRSVAGNAARNAALETALASLGTIDAESLDAGRQSTHAVLTTLFEGALGPSRLVDYGTTTGAWTSLLSCRRTPLTRPSFLRMAITLLLNTKRPPLASAARCRLCVESWGSVT